jgi:hypothetical protein
MFGLSVIIRWKKSLSGLVTNIAWIESPRNLLLNVVLIYQLTVLITMEADEGHKNPRFATVPANGRIVVYIVKHVLEGRLKGNCFWTKQQQIMYFGS